MVARRGEEFVQFVEIVVREQVPLGARQRPADDDAVMSKRIMDDEVLRSEQRADGGNIRGVAADEDDAGLLAVMRGERRLELAVQRTLARDEAAGRAGGAVLLDGPH